MCLTRYLFLLLIDNAHEFYTHLKILRPIANKSLSVESHQQYISFLNSLIKSSSRLYILKYMHKRLLLILFTYHLWLYLLAGFLYLKILPFFEFAMVITVIII